MNRPTIHHGDCLEVMRTLPDASIDAIVTDPPYGLGFMGKAWDDLPPGLPWAQECLRVLKPGGHILAFGGSRTWHRLACAVEDAGFEPRDSIAWLYGSGFPKSMDVSKAITATQTQGGSSRRQNRMAMTGDDSRSTSFGSGEQTATTTATTSKAPPLANLTDDARTWQGWGTALKPAFEPIVVGRKPLVGTVAANVLAHGTGALNIDACRVEPVDRPAYEAKCASVVGLSSNLTGSTYGEWTGERKDSASSRGRWPANVVLDDTQAAELDAQTGVTTSPSGIGRHPSKQRTSMGGGVLGAQEDARKGLGDSGGASRFFPVFKYQAKAPASERPKVDGVAHPTVKPLALMRWLVRLVTPPGGVVLDPFAGSGTTVEACINEGFQCIAIEREADYLPLIQLRIDRAQAKVTPPPADEQPDLFGGVA